MAPVAEVAKALKTEINYKIFDGLPLTNRGKCAGNVDRFLNYFTQKEAASFNTNVWETLVTGVVDECNVWQELNIMTDGKWPARKRSTINADLLNGDLKYHMEFYQKYVYSRKNLIRFRFVPQI